MKKRVLFIKLTSLGDLIHALPALTDAYRAYPEIEFDWLIDEGFQEVATWHPAIRKIFTANHRQWRASLGQGKTYRSIYTLMRGLRREKYDLVLDGQGNFKSAALALCAKGVKAGYDKESIRESIACWAYQKTFSVSWKAHAIERLRALFAAALDYPLPTTPPDFFIDRNKLQQPDFELPPNYVVFVHNASWKTKLWPEEHWNALIKNTVQKGYTVLLPWGSAEEEARAKRLAHLPQVKVLPRLSLSQVGYVLAHARGCVCVDTGLSHMAAALNIPSITLYGATDSGLNGASGNHQTHIQSTLSCAPCYKKQCLFPCAGLNPPCLAGLTPDRVFNQLMNKLR